MNILSLFDGISCAQIALEKSNIVIENYFSSEIDKYAIRVTQKNYPSTIQLGDINSYKSWKLPKIDLIIGGSPCQSFSTSGNRLDFNDPRGKLFFKYIECLNHYRPDWFIFENISTLTKNTNDVISCSLNTNPVEIDSSLVSAQRRKRFYWTNIPNIMRPKDRNIHINSILQENEYAVRYSKKRGFGGMLDKSFPLQASDWRAGSTLNRNQDQVAIISSENNTYRRLTPIECELLQTIPINYTDNVSKSQRYKLIGNAFTVDIIVHLLNFLSS